MWKCFRKRRYICPRSVKVSGKVQYWSGLPFPAPGDLPDLGIELRSPALQADTLPSEPPGKPFEEGKNGSGQVTAVQNTDVYRVQM